jgi:spore germination cell wall hydrolase CwlJ-like protein
MLAEVFLTCLVWNVYFEARGEPLAGQIAVAEVTLRRADLSGRNDCAEVFEDRQFSWTQELRNPRITNKRAWHQAVEAVRIALLGQSNVSRGATHFHSVRVNPRWTRTLCHATTIGRHVFYRPCDVQLGRLP